MSVRSMMKSARGRDRNMTKFAEEISTSFPVSKASLYRIAAGDIKQPVSDELLQAIIIHKAEDCDLTFDDLKAAYDKLIYEDRLTDKEARTEYDRMEQIAQNTIYDIAIKSNSKVQKYSPPKEGDWLTIKPRFDMFLVLEKDDIKQKVAFEIKVNAMKQSTDIIDLYIGMLMRTITPSDVVFYLFFVDKTREDPQVVRDSDRKLIYEPFEHTNLPMNLHIIHLSLCEDGSSIMTELKLGPGEAILSFEPEL